ncbi:MAG: ketoacyl-ACP synthase III [Oxalobacteraceae bacterium]|nr:MAG: ketoacyl-ACP synthase III [Oxalobacteraceae bacterium]
MICKRQGPRVIRRDKCADRLPRISGARQSKCAKIVHGRIALWLLRDGSAAEGETATDLAFAAACRLFDSGAVARADVDFLILCTQAPDYLLPTSACILQHRLGLSTQIGALDINLGCSGFVYGLSLAAGLIASGAASTILLLTADTYSKFIHPQDKSVRTLFGDGAAATLIRAGDPGTTAGIGPFVFGTDGSGAGDLIIEAGGARCPRSAQTAQETTDATGNVRSRDNLYMNGGAVLNFTLREVPRAVSALLSKTRTTAEDYDRFVLHQANKFMLDALQKKLGVPPERVSRHFEQIGNTVSSTIPFVLEREMAGGRCSHGTRMMLVGFGVGLSWAAASIIF